MQNAVFGEMIFDAGFEKKTMLKLWGNDYEIEVAAEAYYETDGITTEQETAYTAYKATEPGLLKIAERLLTEYAQEFSDAELPALELYTPRTLVFERDGSYALLFDDSEDEDNGVAVCLSPEQTVMTQDEYL